MEDLFKKLFKKYKIQMILVSIAFTLGVCLLFVGQLVYASLCLLLASVGFNNIHINLLKERIYTLENNLYKMICGIKKDIKNMEVKE